MSSSCLPLLMAALLGAEPPLEEVIAPGLRVRAESTDERLSARDVVWLLRLELGNLAPAQRELRIHLDEREARLTLRGVCPEAELHENVALRPGLGASRARIVAISAAEFAQRELAPCPLPEPEPLVEPPAAPISWLATLQPFIGARVLTTRPTLLLNAGAELALSTMGREWWGELAVFLQATRVTRTAGVVGVWAPTVQLGLRHEWGNLWRFGLGVRTEASWALLNGTPAQSTIAGQQQSALLLGSSLAIGLRRHLTGVAWFSSELSAGYGWRGVDVNVAERSAFRLGGLWFELRLGVSFDLRRAQ